MKKLFMLLFVFVFLFGFVSAINSISVKSLPSHKVSIFVLDASQTYYLLESFHKTSDINGKVAVSYTGDGKDINVRVVVKSGDKQIVSEKFGPYKPGASISILALADKTDGDYKESDSQISSQNVSQNAVNVSKQNNLNLDNNKKNETANLTSEKKEKASSLSGSAVSGLSGETGLIIGIIVVVIVLLIVLFYVWKKYGRVEVTGGGKVARSGMVNKDSDKRLRQTQRELEEAQREINKLKNRDKINSIERRIEEERKEIERLRKGY